MSEYAESVDSVTTVFNLNSGFNVKGVWEKNILNNVNKQNF